MESELTLGSRKEQLQATEDLNLHEADPGLVIVYENDQMIHDALGKQGAPVAQGATTAALAAVLISLRNTYSELS